MSADRENYVMSIEYAMQREMAYREKLRAQAANIILPSQVSSASHIKQALAPASSQAPKTTLVPVLPPNSTLRPTVGSYTGPNRMQFPLQRPNSLHNISTTSSTPHLTVAPIRNPTPTPLTGPIRPRLLQSPLQRPNSQFSRPTIGQTPYTGPGLLRSPPFQGPRPRPGATHKFAYQKKKKQLHEPPQAEDYRCDLCDVNCNSEFNLRMHLKGQKHKAKLRDSKSMEVSSGVILSQQQGAKQQKYCSLCEVWCPDEKAYRMHVDGRNHILKYHAAEKRMKLIH